MIISFWSSSFIWWLLDSSSRIFIFSFAFSFYSFYSIYFDSISPSYWELIFDSFYWSIFFFCYSIGFEWFNKLFFISLNFFYPQNILIVRAITSRCWLFWALNRIKRFSLISTSKTLFVFFSSFTIGKFSFKEIEIVYTKGFLISIVKVSEFIIIKQSIRESFAYSFKLKSSIFTNDYILHSIIALPVESNSSTSS